MLKNLLSTRLLPYALSVIYLVLSSASLAQEGSAIIVTEQNSPLDVTPVMELFEDIDGSLNISQIAGAEYQDLFVTPENGTANIGFTSSTWWARLSVSNPNSATQTVYLRQDYPMIDELDIWTQQQEGQFVKTETGDRRSFFSRSIKHRNVIVPIELKPHSTQSVYLRFNSDGPINIGLTLFNTKDLLENISNSELGVGIYFGGFIVLVIYNIFLFFAVRDRVFIYYLLYALCYGTYFAVHNGLAFQYFWPNNPWLANQSLLLLLGLTLIFGLQFARQFLDLEIRAKNYDLMGKVLLYTLIAAFISIFVLPYNIVILILAVLSLVTTVLILVMGLQSLISGYKPARYFMLAWSALLVGVIVYMLKTFGLLPHNTATHYGFQIGSLIEMTLLAVALASRVGDIQKQALVDPLTDVGNRRQFDDLMAVEFSRSNRYEAPLSLMVIDLDNFKTVNDTLGHAKGDRILKQVAKSLKKDARKFDSVCRYGGEEFAIIMPNTDLKSANAFAQRLLQKVEESHPGNVKTTVSIGVASIPEHFFETAQDFFNGADSALYQAKERGRNQVAAYVPTPLPRAG